MEKQFDEDLVRLHYRYLNHVPSEIRVYAHKTREATFKERDENRETATIRSWRHWVASEDAFVEELHGWSDPLNTPYQSYVVIRDAEPPGWRHRSGRLIEAANEDIIVGVQTLVLDLEPTEPWRPEDEASTDEQLAACFDFARLVADWSEARGWVRPLLVMSGNGYHVYFAIPRILVDNQNRAAIGGKLAAFESLVRAEFADEAKRRCIKVDNVADLPRIIRVWGTPNTKGEDPSRYRLTRPVDAAPVRREDPVLRDFLLALEPVQRQRGGGGRRGASSKLPLDAVEHVDVYDLGRVPPVDDRGLVAAKDFFGNLGSWRSKHDRSRFLIRVLGALLFLHAQAKGLALDRAVDDVFADKEALERIFRQWVAINADYCVDHNTGLMKGEDERNGGVYRYFMDYSLAYLGNHFEKFESHMRDIGFLPKREARSAKRVKPLPAPLVVGWAERQQAMAAWMEGLLSSGVSGVFVNNAEPSVSKTTVAVRLMVENPTKRFLFVAYSHELLKDVEGRLLKAGLPSDDLVLVEGLKRVCAYEGEGGPERVVQAQAKGVNVRKVFCANCPKRTGCSWHTQKEKARAARVVLAPSAYLAERSHFLEAKVWGNDTRDALFIDEDATSYLMAREDFTTEDLMSYRGTLEFFLGDAPSEYVESMLSMVDFLLAFLGAGVPTVASFVPAMPEARYTSGWRLARERTLALMEGVFINDQDRDLTAALDALLGEALLPREPWGSEAAFDSAAEVATDGQEPRGVTFYKETERAYAFLTASRLPEMPIFILDGTANQDFYQHVFHRQRNLHFFLDQRDREGSFVLPEGRIVQVVDSENSRRKLDEPAAVESLVKSIRAFVQRRRGEHPTRRFLLVTYMDQPGHRYESHFREALEDLGDGLEVRHFGGVRGLDEFKGWDTLIVGGFLLSTVAYANEVRGLMGREPTSLDFDYVSQVLRTPPGVAFSYEVGARCYLDEGMQAAYAQKTQGEQNQAIARSRVLHPDHGKGVMVVVFNGQPIPGLMVEPMRLVDFDAENGIEPPDHRKKGMANPRANQPLFDALVEILSEHPYHPDHPHVTWTKKELMQEVERRLGRSWHESRVGHFWNLPDFEQAQLERLMSKLRDQMATALRSAGVADEGEVERLVEAYADPAMLVGLDLWVPTPVGDVLVQGVGPTRRLQVQAETDRKNGRTCDSEDFGESVEDVEDVEEG
ncbi:MAG: hypothetical protein VKN33_04550 [Candidatus Sericytochromatia bacterium]|nr:hypothetical protein [Candidatus Sericytochromatia bacterium]